jgi:predicted phage terminase large subunit-like protein
LKWSVTYKKAWNDDGSLFFPEKLTEEFLMNAKRTMGSYMFSNQYLNEIIPSDLQTFKKKWFRYYEKLPKLVNTFIYIDPALSEADTADYTGIVVVDVDTEGTWYIRHATRMRVTPTQLIQMCFRLNLQFKPRVIGIEQVAFQKALLYFLNEEMKRRGIAIPVTGIQPPTNQTKQARILSLVPRFEWGHILMAQGLHDLEMELLQFPRGAHDDLIDSLASIEQIAMRPTPQDEFKNKPGPNSPDYEKWFINSLKNGRVANE